MDDSLFLLDADPPLRLQPFRYKNFSLDEMSYR
jgi:hypothetical protein